MDRKIANNVLKNPQRAFEIGANPFKNPIGNVADVMKHYQTAGVIYFWKFLQTFTSEGDFGRKSTSFICKIEFQFEWKRMNTSNFTKINPSATFLVSDHDSEQRIPSEEKQIEQKLNFFCNNVINTEIELRNLNLNFKNNHNFDKSEK